MRIDKVYLFLTGGLGNQLFQLAAAKSLNPNEIKIITSIGHPRLNKEGRADIFSLDIGHEVSEHKLKHPNKFVGKVFGYLLRSSINPTFTEKLFLRKLMRVIATVIIRYEINDRFTICFSDNPSFTNLDQSDRTILLIGYFQSYKYLEALRQIKKNGNVSIFNQQNHGVNKVSLSGDSKLIVHFRIGDYKLDNSFGVVNPTYYAQAIKKVISNHHFDEILIFSDEIAMAKRLISIETPIKTTWVDPIEYDTLRSFQLMQTGQAFIIGNSTFSWWAAALALNRPLTVVAPNPWFAGMPDPKYLIPNEWERINVDFIRESLK
jgi:hypothetical protein